MSTLLRCNLLSCLSCSLCILSRRPERYTHSLQPSNIYQTNGVPTCKPLHCSEMKHKKKVVRAHVCASIHEAAQSWKRQWLSRRTIKSRLTVLRILGALTIDLSPASSFAHSIAAPLPPIVQLLGRLSTASSHFWASALMQASQLVPFSAPSAKPVCTALVDAGCAPGPPLAASCSCRSQAVHLRTLTGRSGPTLCAVVPVPLPTARV